MSADSRTRNILVAAQATSKKFGEMIECRACGYVALEATFRRGPDPDAMVCQEDCANPFHCPKCKRCSSLFSVDPYIPEDQQVPF